MSEKRKDWKAQVNWAIAPKAKFFFISEDCMAVYCSERPIFGTEYMYGFDTPNGYCWYYGDFSGFDFGDWRDTLIERPEEVEQVKPFGVGDVVVNTKGKFIGHILNVSDLEFTIYSEQYTDILRSKGYILNEDNIYTFLKEFIEHAPKDRAIEYQKALTLTALSDPTEETKEFIKQLENQALEAVFESGVFSKKGVEEMKELARNRERRELTREIYAAEIARQSNPPTDSVMETTLLRAETKATYFFQKFGYSNELAD